MRLAIAVAVVCFLVMPSWAQRGKCPDGWSRFANSLSAEGRPSCLTVTVFGAFSNANDACAALRMTAHAATLIGGGSYSATGTNFLSIAANVVGAGNYAVVGCHQEPDSPSGAGNSGVGWIWDDGSDASNLMCNNPRVGCGESAWGFVKMNVRANSARMIYEPTDGDGEDVYNEQHRKDTCVLRGPGSGVIPGLFAFALPADTTDVPILCELDDSDRDGVYDDVDLCPHGMREGGAIEDIFNGCFRDDVDPDHDGVCNINVQDMPYCTGVDNCPHAWNPEQTNSVGGAAGDACNTEGCHEACAYGCDPVAMKRRDMSRSSKSVCTAPVLGKGKFDEEARCNAGWFASSVLGCTDKRHYKRGGVELPETLLHPNPMIDDSLTVTSSFVGENFPYRAFDYDPNTFWSSGSYYLLNGKHDGSWGYDGTDVGGAPISYKGETLSVKLPSEYTSAKISKLVLTIHGVANAPVGFAVAYTDSNGQFKTALRVAGETWTTDGESKTYVFSPPFEAYDAVFMAVGAVPAGQSYASIAEFTLYFKGGKKATESG